MFEKLKTILILLIVTCSLTFLLFGFTIYHKEKLIPREPIQSTESWGCGTSARDPYLIKLRELELTDRVKVRQVQEGKILFDANCKACHRMKQKLVGPALDGVFKRRDSVWIRTFIVDIDILIKRKDKEVAALRKEYNYTQHTRFTSMAKDDLDNLIHYLQLDPGGVMLVEQKVIACP